MHHIVERKEAPGRALELENLTSLCAKCHNRRHPDRARKGGGKQKQPKGERVIKVE